MEQFSIPLKKRNPKSNNKRLQGATKFDNSKAGAKTNIYTHRALCLGFNLSQNAETYSR